jgi:hypothetical protein
MDDKKDGAQENQPYIRHTSAPGFENERDRAAVSRSRTRLD